MKIAFENLLKIDLLLEKMNILEQKISGAKKWLNISETAHYLGYSKDYIHKLKDTNFILNKHYYKKSGKLLFDKDELDSWVTASSNLMNPKDIANEILKDLI
ncbi:MAG: helix-turn-helix domain-containing protein [Campylobacterota bacterium]|nr:helix-turn-helix domain-containing protein [Campylobacterota bacterium]